MKKKIAFVINPISGTGSKNSIPDLIHSDLDTALFEPQILFTESRFHGRDLANGFAEAGYYAVVAVGGDGTVNEVARSLIHTDTALGIIPIGSGNGLARHLNIPLNVKKAIETINHAEVIQMDYGIVNSNPFFCTCGTGFDAYVSTEFAKGKERGIMAYIEKMITGYFNYKSQEYHLTGEDIDLKSKAFVMTFANASQWGNNAYIAPQASVQDGMMDISILSNFPVIAIPSLAIQLLTKTIDKDFFMTTLRTKEVVLHRDAPGPFHFDGEPYDEGTEIRVKMVADGLKVLTKKRF
jgi:YegS/Rv2252/BmrU family lipid kinase